MILLVFGPRRLPEMARGLGQSVREFRKGIRDIKDDIAKEEERPNAVTVAPSTAQQSSPPPSAHAPSTHVGPESATQVHEVRTEPAAVQSAQTRADDADAPRPKST